METEAMPDGIAWGRGRSAARQQRSRWRNRHGLNARLWGRTGGKQGQEKQDATHGSLRRVSSSTGATGPKEARFAVWNEIELVERIWTIPAERMKMRRGHIVPITDRMVEILTEAKRRRNEDALPSDIIFVAGTGKALSEMAALMLMRGMEAYKGFTAHGFRATFRGWAGTKTEFARELIEEQLAHQLGKVEEAYLRQSAYERRRIIMNTWAAVCAGETPAAGAGNVVPLRANGNGV